MHGTQKTTFAFTQVSDSGCKACSHLYLGADSYERCRVNGERINVIRMDCEWFARHERATSNGENCCGCVMI